MKESLKALMPAALLLATGLVGCTKDTAYDQLTEDDGIDLTITVAPNGLTLPLGSTNRISITEVLDTAKTKILEIDSVNNVFFIRKSGSLDATHIEVDKVSFAIDPKMSTKEFAMDVKKEWTPEQQTYINSLDADSDIPAFYGKTFQISAVRDDMSLGDTEEDDLGFKFENDDTDPAIVFLLKADFERSAQIKMSLDLENLPSKEQEYNIGIEDLRMDIPSFFVLTDANNQELSKIDGKYLIPTNYVHKNAGTDKAFWEMADVRLSRLDFGNDTLYNNNGHIEREGDVKVYGQLIIDNLTVAGEDLKVVGHRTEGDTTNNTVMLKQRVKVSPIIEVDSIIINSLTGMFNPTINDMKFNTNLDFDKKLDFLTDERTYFDPKEAYIDIDMAYNCPLDAVTDLTIRNGYGKTSKIDDILIHQPESGLLHLQFNNNHEDRDKGIYQFDNLNNVIVPIPEWVALTMGVDIVQKVATFELGKRYNVSADYDLDVILDFKSVDATYEELIEDVFDDIRDNIHELCDITLEIEALSALPLDAEVSLMGRDENGKEDPSLLNCENTGSLKAGSVANPATSIFTINVKNVNVDKTKDLVLKVHVTGGECSLTPDQYFEITKMSLSFKGQTIDLND